MMSEKPVLASYSGYQSMINEAGSGFFIPAEDTDAIKSKLEEILLINSCDLALMGKNGKNWIVNNRDWDVVTKKYNDLIINLFYDR
jgi:glycosyltransferase involved in cell wall biosynthesis